MGPVYCIRNIHKKDRFKTKELHLRKASDPVLGPSHPGVCTEVLATYGLKASAKKGTADREQQQIHTHKSTYLYLYNICKSYFLILNCCVV